jgi:hypothetical protein
MAVILVFLGHKMIPNDALMRLFCFKADEQVLSFTIQYPTAYSKRLTCIHMLYFLFPWDMFLMLRDILDSEQYAGGDYLIPAPRDFTDLFVIVISKHDDLGEYPNCLDKHQ